MAANAVAFGRSPASSKHVSPGGLKLWHLLLMLALTSIFGTIHGDKLDGPGGTLTGVIFALTAHAPKIKIPVTFYLHELVSGSSKIHRVKFCPSVLIDGVRTGIPVTVAYNKVVDGVVHTCELPVEATAEDEAEKQQVVAHGSDQHHDHLRRRRLRMGAGERIVTPLEPRILVYITTFCGHGDGPAATPQQVTDLFLTGSASIYKNRSLAGYYSTCSYGRVSLKPANVRVLGPVQIPCSGAIWTPYFTDPTFTSSSCDERDSSIKWHLWLEEWAADKFKVAAGDYHHRVLILPKGFMAKKPGCNNAAGVATVGTFGPSSGAYGTSLVWWSGDNFGDLELLMHELGHNYWMGHANIPGGCDLIDQCDHTCTMGGAGGQGIRCLNAPHNWQVGWGRPFRQFNEFGLQIGSAVGLRIPLQLTTPNHSVLVTGNGLPAGQRLFIAARANIYPYELPYTAGDDGKTFLIMHTYAGTDETSSVQTTLVGQIEVGGTWRDLNSLLSVRFDSWDRAAGVAVVRICRRYRDTEDACGDGLDDDCDFLTDKEDADCKSGPRPTSRPSPPPPSPPPSPPPPSPPPPPPLPPLPSPPPLRPPKSPPPRKSPPPTPWLPPSPKPSSPPPPLSPPSTSKSPPISFRLPPPSPPPPPPRRPPPKRGPPPMLPPPSPTPPPTPPPPSRSPPPPTRRPPPKN